MMRPSPFSTALSTRLLRSWESIPDEIKRGLSILACILAVFGAGWSLGEALTGDRAAASQANATSSATDAELNHWRALALKRSGDLAACQAEHIRAAMGKARGERP